MQSKIKTLPYSLLIAVVLLSSAIFWTPASALGQPDVAVDGSAYTISGNAGVGGATLGYDNGGPQTAAADGNGLYSFTVPSGWSGTVTPAKAGYAFTPASRDYSGGVFGDQASQDYSAAIRKQVSSGRNHSCGIQPGGALHCWGDDSRGATTPPGGIFTQISAGSGYSCGLKTNGALLCWGYMDLLDPYVAGPPNGTFTQVSAGGYVSCALKIDGALACWGWDGGAGVVSNTPAGVFTQVGAGGQFACGLRADGTLTCWGDDDYGEVSGTPAGIFTQIGVGDEFACGIHADGTVACWGNDNDSQVSGAPSGVFTQISAGRDLVCGLRADSTVSCWGDSDNPSGGGTFTQVDAGSGYACGVRSDTQRWVCWGWDNEYGQLKPYRISGKAGASFATVSYDDNGHETTLTQGTGTYSLGVSDGWSGTVTIAQPGFTFNPPSRTYSNVIADQVNRNYTPTLTLTSIGSQDGWLLESKQGSGLGGASNASSSAIILGDNAANRQYRTILSFNTSPMTGTVTTIVTSAILKLYRSGQAGSSPFKALGKLLVDIRQGPFGDNPALRLTDFNAPASATNVGGNPTYSGKWYSLPLAARGRIRAFYFDSPTQFRLYFSLPSNANKAADWISFVSGNGPAAFRPQLVITYLP